MEEEVDEDSEIDEGNLEAKPSETEETGKSSVKEKLISWGVPILIILVVGNVVFFAVTGTGDKEAEVIEEVVLPEPGKVKDFNFKENSTLTIEFNENKYNITILGFDNKTLNVTFKKTNLSIEIGNSGAFNLDNDNKYDVDIKYKEFKEDKVEIEVENIAIVVCDECKYYSNRGCSSYLCCTDEDCEDGKDETYDDCISPSTEQAKCESKELDCLDCQYIEGGRCVNYGCCLNLDCYDEENSTRDECKNPKTKKSYCVHIRITPCVSKSDCHDWDPCTRDSCNYDNGNCTNTVIAACVNDDECCPNACTNETDTDC